MSSKRLSPKEIKRDIREDELSTAVESTMDRIYDNWQVIVYGLGGLLLVFIIGWGVNSWLGSQRADANSQLSEAIDTYVEPDVDDSVEAAQKAYVTDESKRQEARDEFDKISGMTGSGTAGDVAELYVADVALAEGDTATARQIWETFLDRHGDHLLGVSVRLNLISLDRQEGKAEDVAERLRLELESPKKTMPEDVVLYELARTLEQLDRTTDAADYYQQLLDEYPQSPYASDARLRVAG
ncbi:MAG: tetratricopeptide repeat protein [Acidobacteriota bacterium]